MPTFTYCICCSQVYTWQKPQLSIGSFLGQLRQIQAILVCSSEKDAWRVRVLCRNSAIQQKTGKRFINQALYIKSLNDSISSCMNKTIATYTAYLKALHTRVKASIQQSTIVCQYDRQTAADFRPYLAQLAGRLPSTNCEAEAHLPWL